MPSASMIRTIAANPFKEIGPFYAFYAVAIALIETNKPKETGMADNNPNQNREQTEPKPKQVKGFRGMDISNGKEKGPRSSEEVAAARKKNVEENEKGSRHSKDEV